MEVNVKETVKVSLSPQKQKLFHAGKQEVTEDEAAILDGIGYLVKKSTSPEKTPAKQVTKKAAKKAAPQNKNSL